MWLYHIACIKVHREDEPNTLIYKHSIKYLHKQEDEAAPRLVESSSES